MSNVQSLWPKLDEFRLILATFKPDVACLTETWLTQDINSNLIKVDGYHCVRSDRQIRRGGGTAIYVQENVSFNSRDVIQDFNQIAEVTFLEILELNLAIVCVYIPPSTLATHLEDIRDQLVRLSDNYLSENSENNVVILGDFNHFNTHNLSCDLFLFDIVDRPTRGNNILDHIMISKELRDIYDSSCVSYNPAIGKADHKCLLVTPHNETLSVPDKRQHTVYDFRNSNTNFLMQKACEVDWREISRLEEVNEMWSSLKSKISSLIETCIPRHTVCITTKDKSWITPLTKHMINEKWKAYRMQNWMKFNHFKRKVRKEIGKAKTLWAEKLKSSNFGLWKLANHISGKAGAKGSISFTSSGVSLGDAAERIADLMCLNSRPQPLLEHANCSSDTSSKWNISFSEWEIAKSLKKLPRNKASGSDGIPNLIYALLGDFLAGPLKSIFECSVSKQALPLEWKEGVVIPVPKTNPPQLDKLRMITLLPSPSKILEKMILGSVRQSLEPLYGAHQHGFRKNCSTTTALLQITDNALRVFDDLCFSAFSIMSLDLSKAFDKVDHGILLKKLGDGGLPTPFTKWIANYVADRSIRVKIQDYYSHRRYITTGVPQGSVLGPALFCIMVGDFKCAYKDSAVTQYADDISIVTSFQTSNPDIVTGILRDEMENFTRWCQRNKQVHNQDKTQLLFFDRSSRNFISHLSTCISTCSVMKILGVFLNAELTWHHHVNEMCKKASKRLRILRVLKPHVSQMELHQVYVATILSVFDYACPVFVGLETGLSERLQKIDNRAHRIIFGKDARSCDCSSNSVKTRRERLSKNLLTKCLNSDGNILSNCLPTKLPRSGKLCNFFCRTERRRRSFFPLTTYLSNIDT